MTQVDQTLKQLQDALQTAINERENWELQDLHRRDGSGAQDRRHEERGERLENHVHEARRALNAYQAQTDKPA